MLEIRVLGPLEVLVGGRPVPLGGRKQRALVALLVMSANEPVPADRLLEEVWVGTPVESAARSLQVYISTLRKALGPAASALLTRPGGYSLAIGPEEIDASRADRLLRAARSARLAGDPASAASSSREALALWRGPPFADLAYETFALPEISRLEELRLALLDERIEADLALGRHAELVAELEALVGQHPLRERLRAQLMLALYMSGRQSDALACYEAGRRVLRDELGLDPTPALGELQAAILRHDRALSVEPVDVRARRHLPAPATRLVGRASEVSELVSLVGDEGVRLVTLTGPGGIGKTRLALQAAHDLATRFPDGVWFVGLGSLVDPELVPSAVATALRTKEASGASQSDRLARHLAPRTTLLVLDNFEHVLEARWLVSELLAAAPDVQVIVTSRSRLGLYGEHELPVPPLTDEAAALFTARAKAVDRHFALTPANTDAVAALCHRLDGLPLAIELAAARAADMAPDRMLAELPLALASQGPSDAPPRHHTLRATIRWSYGLLTPSARQLFRRLAVFTGGCTAEAAGEVCDADTDALSELVDASLLRRTLGVDGDARLTMLETVRAFAAEVLEASGEADAVGRRHARWYVELAERFQPLRGRRLLAIDAEHDNVRAALSAANAAGDAEVSLRLCAAVWRYWYVRGLLTEGAAYCRRALESAPGETSSARAAVLRAASVFAWALADHDAAVAFASTSLDMCQQLGDDVGATRALISLGIATQSAGRLAEARALHEQSRALAERLGMVVELGAALANLGDVALLEGDVAGAEARYGESLAVCRRSGDDEGSAIALMCLGVVALHELGHPDEAAASFSEGLQLFDRLGFTENIAVCLTGLAAADGGRNPVTAARLLGAADALRSETGGTSSGWWERVLVADTTDAVRRRLGPASFSRAFDRGRSDPRAVVSEALHRPTAGPPPPRR